MDLNLIPLLIAVAEERNFRAAADRLGVTRSAVSQGVRRLEDALGQQLVMRTTRSVRLTEAGSRLVESVRGPLQSVQDALEARDEVPRGRLRLAVASIAEPFLAGPLLARFAEQHPEVTIDVTVTDDEFDIVAHGFDAGVRLGEVIEQDMIAVPVGGPQREIAAASPGYLTSSGTPKHPSDLLKHRCIGWRPAPETAPWRWEFSDAGQPFNVAVEPQVTTNDLRLMLRVAIANGGITFGPWECFEEFFAQGSLVPLLEEYLPPFAGFYLYFPQRLHMAPKLRALVDHVRKW
ncbi:MAG: LysR substrate-binding domain-containing protein [Alphaproteobacteria bacterium]|jgi:DNA-binding transcriptional LysR family regulator|uniref:LysR family transcriptional regulator n=1 Tax=Maricaulis alexandrii TaxID=2570354 RepID=UPI001108BEDB|nr:LysR family transcriptional regulator [Maricaulis alexandrii]MCR9266493.1 LysR substrate-binding domain-containing protein [Alphaproteobacteria bacterium]